MKVWSYLALALFIAQTERAPGISPGVMRQLGDSIADTVEKVMPAVVVVRTESVILRPARDPLWGDVYGIPEKLAGQGSGVIIDAEGYVLTSQHVIADARQVEVVLNDGAKFPAVIVGRDRLTDLAVLRIDAPGRRFVPAEAGDSDRLRVGEFVIAVGSPFSLGSSVTAGIVSQKGRAIGRLPYEDFIQTDAPINPGNSGGPLVDADGRVVGICAAIQTAGPFAGGNIGIGFAVPANLAMRIAESIIRTGVAERPWLGIQMLDIAEAPAGRFPAGEHGVLVGRVLDNTPAARGGLKTGDIILEVDGQAVTAGREVQRLVFKHRIGEIIKLRVRRGERESLFEIVSDRMPELDGPVFQQ